MLLATLGLVALNGFFVAAEFAAVGARTSRLEVDAKTRPLSRLALMIKRQLDLYLSTCQLGITIASLALGAVTEPAIASLIDPVLYWLGVPDPGVGKHTAYAIAIALSVSTALHVVVGEVAPKNWAIYHPDKILPAVAVPLIGFTYLFYPLIWLLNSASNLLLRLSGVEIHGGGHGTIPHTEAELRALLQEAVEQGTIDAGRETILTSAFRFSDLKVRQIMTPRTKVDFLKLDQPINEVLSTVQRSSFTRLPLCDGDVDHVVGLVHMKDLFNHLQLTPGKLKFLDERDPDGIPIAIPTGLPGSAIHVIGAGDIDLRKIRREILFVPEATPAPRVLRQFQTKQIHMAVVVDEYGATRGVVTLEDIIEQIVGDIADEFDTAPTTAFVVEGNTYRVRGDYALHDLRTKLDLKEIEAGDVDTIGGYVIEKLGRWPKAGDEVKVGPHTAKVLSIRGNRVDQLLLSPTPEEKGEEK